jgi:hypothetical protein
MPNGTALTHQGQEPRHQWLSTSVLKVTGVALLLDAPEPDGILAAALISARLPPEHEDVIGDAAQRPQDPVFVDHGLPCPSRDGGGELPV